MNSQTETKAFKGWQLIQPIPIRRQKKLQRCWVWVKGIIGLYNKHGKNWYSFCYRGKRGGRRAQRCHLSLDDEKLFMKSLENEALSGNILTFRHIKQKAELLVGKEVSDDYIWDLFARHGWKKKISTQRRTNLHRKSIKKTQRKSGIQIIRVWKSARWQTCQIVFSGWGTFWTNW